jgi:alcohol dehydrogenase, propanol-preferring
VRALQLTAPEEDFAFAEVPEPDPRPGQVVVKVGGAGVCHSDLHLKEWPAEQLEALGFQLPFTLGHENAGWVDAVGDGVHGLEVGQPVAVYGPWGCGRCSRCREGRENYCRRPDLQAGLGGGLGLDGGMASKLLVPDARLLVPLGDLDPVQAAPLSDAALTPYHAIKRSIPKLTAGSTAVVIGIGGLGHLAVELLRELTPARIIAVDLDEGRLALAQRLGAHEVVRSDADAADTIRAMTGGQGAELVIDVVGAQPTVELAAAAVAVLGDLSIVGIGGGTLPLGFFTIPYEASVQTTYWGYVTELMELLELARQGRIAVTTTTFRLDDAMEAYARLEAGDITGRAVVTPNL